MNREVLILQNLKDGPNVIDLQSIIQDPLTKTPALVTEHITNFDHKFLYKSLSEWHIKYYMYQLLKVSPLSVRTSGAEDNLILDVLITNLDIAD